MGGGLGDDAPIDYATVQIFPADNSYEAYVCYHKEIEKLAVGPLEQLLPHIPGLNCLITEGSNASFKIQIPGNLSGATWLTRSTLSRFLDIVSSRDLISIAKVIEGEISQLEEARKFHLSLYAQGNQDQFEARETDGCKSDGIAPQVKSDIQAASSDTSKNELLRAMDLRLSALRGEIAAAFNKAAGATFSDKDLADLAEFYQHATASGLNNSLFKVEELGERCQSADTFGDDKSSFTRVAKGSSGSVDAHMLKPSNPDTLVVYGVSPAKAAQVERQSSTESEDSSDSSEEIQTSVERSRAPIRSASPRRSASPMRRVQIGRSGSRRPTAVTVKSLNHFPIRERTWPHRDVAADSGEEDGSEQTGKITESNVQRMSVQDKISLFESKQRDQTTNSQKRNSYANVSLSGNKSVLRRWSAGMGDSPTHSQIQMHPEDLVPAISNPSTGENFKISAEEKSESNFVSGGQNHNETAKVDIQPGRWEDEASDPTDHPADIDGTERAEMNERLTASAEWSRQKEAELNQMMKKMMESRPIKSRKPSSNRNQLHAEQKGSFSDNYKEKRGETIRGQNSQKRAERAVHTRTMQKSLNERKSEMSSKNVNDVAKRSPNQKPQKSLRNSVQSANTKNKKETPKPSLTQKVSSKTSSLPATRKSWPSTPLPRATATPPAKTPSVSSTGTTPTRRKPSSATSVPRPSPKTERSNQQLKCAKDMQTNNNRGLKGTIEKQQPVVGKSGRTLKPKGATASGDTSPVVPAKPSLYSRVTKKSSVVPLESRPFLRKGSGNGPGVGPLVNKTKVSPQKEAPLMKSMSLVETEEVEVVANSSEVVREHQQEDVAALGHCDAVMEIETTATSPQICNAVETVEESAAAAAADEDNLKNKTETSPKIEAEEESMISPTAWVEIEEENQDLSIPSRDNTSQPAPPAEIIPMGFSSPRVRHSLSQMLQEESSEADTSEWGNAENPPVMVFHKDTPKGLKRLLKFARKSKGDASSTGWSSPSVFSEGEDDTEESRALNKRSADNLLRKAALHAKSYGMPKTLLSEDCERNGDGHLSSGQSNIGRFDSQNSQKLHKSHTSSAAPTTKATRSFFSLSAFRGSKHE